MTGYKSFDLVLMDMQMPVMDGLEATKRIRKLDNKDIANIPIIAMTANAMESDRDLCIAAGMDDYISKPINPVDLFSTISACVRKLQDTDTNLISDNLISINSTAISAAECGGYRAMMPLPDDVEDSFSTLLDDIESL